MVLRVYFTLLAELTLPLSAFTDLKKKRFRILRVLSRPPQTLMGSADERGGE